MGYKQGMAQFVSRLIIFSICPYWHNFNLFAGFPPEFTPYLIRRRNDIFTLELFFSDSLLVI
ncbi:MAG: hypothetical protein HYY80_00290 [Chloroflexi bacterium]|nr:hypothetical protein [Chloroflexota bacterium]